ncbi:MAG: Na/Pi cotransporter family protein [Clostridiales bacterium]|nr:Na/Pi cotransporter family protein [Clostridiales bacterium]
MNLFDVFYLLGGLAMFLFGMHLMGESLERQAGRRLKSILGQLTNKPLKGVLLGTAVTAVIQSSSATTVMVVGFVNSGIMQLNQAIPVIMGANIGTTITSWILSLTGIRSDSLLMTLLKPSTFSPLIAFAGIVLLLTSRRRRDTAGIMLGFSVLMFGMEQMSAAVAGLAEVPAFRELLVLFTNPLFGVAVGALVTAIIQSSSASVGILQAIANTGSLTYGAALPIIMGQNIGTCITAILSSIGANRNAKRVGMVHLYFNLIGTGVFLSVFYVLDWLIGFTFTALPINAFGIAVAHTAFNIGTVILLYPMRSLLEWLARKTIRDSKESEKLELLDQRLLNTPSVAIEQCRRLTVDMANLAQQAFLLADGLLDQYDAKAATEVEEIEQTVDRYEDRLGAYLLQVSALHLSEYESKEVSKLLYGIGDFERISDHAVNLTEVAQELHTKNIGFSPEAQVETSTMRAAVKEIMALTVKVFDTNNQELARKVEPLEEVVDVLRETIKANHIERLRTGTCTIELGFVLSDLLTNLERISDHCSNIAVNVMEQTGRGGLESHAYLHELHEGAPNSSFRMQYEAYLNKYDIASKLDELALPEGVE